MIRNLYLRLAISFILCLTLSILPAPGFLSICRPPWMLLLILYIEYFLPGQFKLTVLVFVGLTLDVLLSTVIGEHSFALLLVTWIASSKTRRFQFFSLLQQIAYVGFFCFLYQATISILDALFGFNYSLTMPIVSAGVGMMLWPWICLLGDVFLRALVRYRVQHSNIA